MQWLCWMVEFCLLVVLNWERCLPAAYASRLFNEASRSLWTRRLKMRANTKKMISKTYITNYLKQLMAGPINLVCTNFLQIGTNKFTPKLSCFFLICSLQMPFNVVLQNILLWYLTTGATMYCHDHTTVIHLEMTCKWHCMQQGLLDTIQRKQIYILIQIYKHTNKSTKVLKLIILPLQKINCKKLYSKLFLTKIISN